MTYSSNRITLSLKKEILTHAITWMNPEDMLSEISQSQKDKYCRIPLLSSAWLVKFRDKENGGCQRLGEGKWKVTV